MSEPDAAMDNDAIAVVGMAGRFPGAPNVESLWTLLMDRRDAIGPVPADRWDAAAQLDPEKDVQAVGGFISDVDLFDPGFFGISPREAVDIDPQQRLLLEMIWRALEDAGQPAAGLAGSRTGVYVGASWHDYEILRKDRGARPTQHSLVGNALDVLASRVSYVLRLRGPSLTVETGCSSALVALHLAATALRLREVEGAFVGAANLILTPDVSVGLTHFGGLSPDGRCAAFSAPANGFVRGEGVAALYIKTLRRAVADGDQIHGVISCTAVNNDGGGDSLVTPSLRGQKDLLHLAYGDPGGLTERDGAPSSSSPRVALAYLEAHGTGTHRGDPVEATAIGQVLGPGRSAPLPIGSVKTNIGHLEAAAGMAGLFKVLLALRHRIVPPSRYADEPNPAIPFDELNLALTPDPVTLPPTGPVHLGVNSFGWGGTNAHVVVSSPPEIPPPAVDDKAPSGLPVVVPISARTPEVLAERAGELLEILPDTPDGVVALAATLGPRRDHFAVRAAVVGAEPARLRRALEAVREHPGAESTLPHLVTGRAVLRDRVAFVFPGQGAQWAAMGAALYENSPLFANRIRRCAEALRPLVSWDLIAVLTGAVGDGWLARNDIVQPAVWATSLGLAELWRAAGVQPDVVIGHSQGEVTAATFAGILSDADAALVMARRSAIVLRTAGRGLMLAVDLDPEDARTALSGFEDSVSLAAHNGPRSCVLSGEREAVLALRDILEAEGVYTGLVKVDYASHSPQMDELTAELHEALAPLCPRPSEIPLMSSCQRRLMTGTDLDAGYWVGNLRNPVHFADSMATLLGEGVTHVIEVSPHPVLAPAVEQLTTGQPVPAAVLTTTHRDSASPEAFALAVARGYAAGLEPFAGARAAALPAPAPGYPFQRDHYWPRPGSRPAGAGHGPGLSLCPAPGEPGSWHARVDLTLTDLPWLVDHQVHEATVLPGTAMLALFVDAARSRTGSLPRRLDEVRLQREVTVEPDHGARLTVEWRDDASGGGLRLFSLQPGDSAWTVNATARAATRSADTGVASPKLPELGNGWTTVKPDEFYQTCVRRGLNYGPAFQTVRSLAVRSDGRAAVGLIRLPDHVRPQKETGVPHPALWDGALQVSIALHSGDEALVPVAVRCVRILAEPAESDGPARPTTEMWSYAVLRDDVVDVYVFDADRRPALVMEGLCLAPLTASLADGAESDRLYRLRWVEREVQVLGGDASGRWVLCGDDSVADALAEALTAVGAEAVSVIDAAAASPLLLDATHVVFVAPRRGLAEQKRGLLELAELVRACGALSARPALDVVTVGAQEVVPGDVVDPGAALYWGFGRVLRREHPELGCCLVDVSLADAGWAATCAAALGCDLDDQVALRNGRRLVGRISRSGRLDEPDVPRPPRLSRRQPFCLSVTGPGLWEGLVYRALARRQPAADEIEVEITATGLNFIDVMKALGTYPDPSGEASLLGGECVGRVCAVGAEVTAFALDDRVVACGFGALGSHITIPAQHARPVPEVLSDADAAALPLALVTAWYGLVEVARLQAGETVLVHSAAGGVGLAAIQVARAIGAQVIATGGSPAKRDYLRTLGIEKVFDSRDLAWADEIRAATAGRGVDVVLNSLAGAAIPLGLDVLAEDGRFIELGKADIYGGGRVGLEAFRKGISLSAVDLAGMISRRPRRFARLLDTVWEHVSAGRLGPLPVREYPFDAASTALLEMSRGTHIGKFVLVNPGTVEAVAPVPMPEGRFRADGSYLITGGLGALGLSVCEFLAANGAGNVALLGRSQPSPEALDRIAVIRGGGTRVEILGCDVSDPVDLHQALRRLRQQLPALRGVVHAAGVLADAPIQNLTAEQVAAVFAGKVDGAQLLDEATAGDPLDFFVLFSSAAALVGNIGQAAYAAGNAYLDAIAQARRARGVPALSVQWGPFTDVGLAAAEDRRGARLESRGMGGFTTSEAWRALTALLDTDEPVVGYVPLDLRRWFDAYPETAALASWDLLRAAAEDHTRSGAADVSPAASDLVGRIIQAAPDSRAELVGAKVRELAGRVLRLAPERVDEQTPLRELGLDSLMSIELRNRLEFAFGLRLSPTLLWTHGSVRPLAAALCRQLVKSSTGED